MQTVKRLYNFFQPTNYALELNIDRKNRHYNGNVAIDGHKTTDDQPIMLHTKGLDIIKVTVDQNEVDFFIGGDDEITIKTSLPQGQYHVTIYFSGTITDSLHGLYPCYYEHDGNKKELLVTQFESHHAREVFPCIDEPEAKATYDLTLITEPGITVLGNMPIKQQLSDTNTCTTIFETSPRMSTYLLAFVIGELQKKTAKTNNGVEVNVYATLSQPPEGLDFALETATKCIDFFDTYFDTAYPLPKLDHVAVPDFSSGAMENWGLVTYREAALIVDKNSSVTTREFVATVIAHETSHQWFGNLVTMKWWDDLWLNESFATVMEYIAVDSIYPDWNIWDTFATQESLSALRRDQLAGVQPVKCTVNHPDEITTLFDPSIVYAKGGRLLNMLRIYIGENAWRAGLKQYFLDHAYNNTVGNDLWNAFSAVTQHDIASFMDTWISQAGFPLVNIETTDDGYRLSQHHFVMGAEPTLSLWPIPLRPKDERLPNLLTEKTVDIIATAHQPFLNVGNTSHFIAKYDKAAFETVIQMLKENELGQIDRLAFLHETTLLARAGELPTARCIPLLLHYKDEQHDAVWDMIAGAIADLKRFVEYDESAEANLKNFVTKLTLPLYTKLGFDERRDDSEQTIKLRATIIGLLSHAEYPEVITKGLESFHSTENVEDLPNEIRAIIFSIAAKAGTSEDFMRLVELHDTTANAELRDDITSGLCATRDNEQIVQLLGRLTNSQIIRPQDLYRWFIYLLRNRYGREAAWQWMVENWRWIEQTFDGDKSYDNFPRYSAAVLSTREWYERYRAFFMPLSNVVALKRSIDVGLTDIDVRVQWLERDSDEVKITLSQIV